MTKQITVRVPDVLEQFVRDRAATLHATSTAVVVQALQAEMRRCAIADERALLSGVDGNLYPDLPPATLDDVSDVWKDLD